jgi:3-oxo-5-alpha-steroid 4-dehydrogenase 1
MLAFVPFYYGFLYAMLGLAVVIFIALQFVTVAYGMTFNNRWGISINSKWGWWLMETPVFVAMLVIYGISLCYGIKDFNIVTSFILLLFLLHYGQRSFVFPLLMKGDSKMPLSVIFFGIFFNFGNAFMQGCWLFIVSPNDMYEISWFWSPQFIIGTAVFFFGMTINMHSDRIIRKLRKSKEDNNYYLPKGFLFERINSSNYFGELLEWLGFAILTWSFAGFVFFCWAFANLVSRAKAVYHRYYQFFGEDFTKLNRWKIFPYIY